MIQTAMLLTVVAIGAILLSASVFDWKYREIPDWHWVLMFIIAFCVSMASVIENDIGPIGYLMPACIVLIAFDCLYDREGSVLVDVLMYGAIAVTAIVPIMFMEGDVPYIFVSIPVMYAAMNVLYYTGIVRGGADAKSIIAIAAVFRVYPQLSGLPMIDVPVGLESRIFVPAFAILTMALVISMSYGAYNIVRNVVSGNLRFPQMFLGTPMPLDKANKSKVWPMEDIIEGERVLLNTANEDTDAWKRLEAHGTEEVWCTAIIPFLVPITMAYFLTITVGFPLFIL